MNDVDTSREAVERLAKRLAQGEVWSAGMKMAAATLRALLAERDAARDMSGCYRIDPRERKPDAPWCARAVAAEAEAAEAAARADAMRTERDKAIAARNEAIRLMGEASRQAGGWQGIAEGKDIVIRQLEVTRDAAFRAGAEAMRTRAAEDTDCGCPQRQGVLAELAAGRERRARQVCSHMDACLALQAAAIRALPLPEPEADA